MRPWLDVDQQRVYRLANGTTSGSSGRRSAARPADHTLLVGGQTTRARGADVGAVRIVEDLTPRNKNSPRALEVAALDDVSAS